MLSTSGVDHTRCEHCQCTSALRRFLFEARFLDGWLTSQVDFDTWAVFVPGTGTLEIVFSYGRNVYSIRFPRYPFWLSLLLASWVR